MKEVGVGILGFGTVGAGVAQGLLEHRAVMAERLGVDIVLRKIADLDITTDRGVAVPEGTLTTDASSIISDDSIAIVVETIGGTGIAKKLVMDALAAKKCVVTANKKLLAEHGKEIFDLAAANGVDIYFGASVGGGIPIIRVLREGLAGNELIRCQCHSNRIVTLQLQGKTKATQVRCNHPVTVEHALVANTGGGRLQA